MPTTPMRHCGIHATPRAQTGTFCPLAGHQRGPPVAPRPHPSRQCVAATPHPSGARGAQVFHIDTLKCPDFGQLWTWSHTSGGGRCADATPNQRRIGPLDAAGPPTHPPSPQCVYAPSSFWALWKTLWTAVENSGCVHTRQCRGSAHHGVSVATGGGVGFAHRCARAVAFAPQLRWDFGLCTIRCVTGEGGGGGEGKPSARRQTQSWRIDL